MDNDEAGMDVDAVKLPDCADKYVSGRDLTTITPEIDVTLDLSSMELEGNFFNSTTNLHMEKECKKGGVGTNFTFGGMFAPPKGVDGSFLDAPVPEGVDGPPVEYDKELRGPKNLSIHMIGTRIEGIISSASQAYRKGLKWIDETQRLELSNITQEAAPTINNGVIVTVDTNSTWIVTDTCYLTKLVLEEHAIVKGLDSLELSMTVDGKKTKLEAGKSYEGKIMLTYN